jgi:hypothetical protein
VNYRLNINNILIILRTIVMMGRNWYIHGTIWSNLADYNLFVVELHFGVAALHNMAAIILDSSTKAMKPSSPALQRTNPMPTEVAIIPALHNIPVATEVVPIAH